MPFEMFNPWGTNSSGWAPGGQVYGLFNANAAFMSQNFITQAVGTGTAPETDTISRAFSTGLASNKMQVGDTSGEANEHLAAGVESGNAKTGTTASLQDKVAVAGLSKSTLWDTLWADALHSELGQSPLGL
jgi:hypothetical protein